MNERIKQLAEQAGMGPWGVGNDDNVSEIVEKFAELIVRECAQQCFDLADKLPTGDFSAGLKMLAYNIAGETIKEHFGVNPNEITTAMLDTAINQIEEYKKYVAQQQKENLPHISYGSWELYNKPKKEQE